MKISVIIPVFRGDRYLPELLDTLKNQDVEDLEILVVETEPGSFCREATQKHGARWIAVDATEFDHAGTRTMAAREARGDILVFLSQDVLPSTPSTLSLLIQGLLENNTIGAAYGRQIAPNDDPPWGSIKRGFIYREGSHIRTQSDGECFGFKATFLSNAFAAYRRQALEEAGWFGDRSLMCEDTSAGARLLLKGWSIAYVADATVVHDHPTALGIEARRYFDIGAAYRDLRWTRGEFGPPRPEGRQFITFGIHHLAATGRSHLIPAFATRGLVKLAAYHLGKRHHLLPRSLVTRLSGFPDWWRRK